MLNQITQSIRLCREYSQLIESVKRQRLEKGRSSFLVTGLSKGASDAFFAEAAADVRNKRSVWRGDIHSAAQSGCLWTFNKVNPARAHGADGVYDRTFFNLGELTRNSGNNARHNYFDRADLF